MVLSLLAEGSALPAARAQTKPLMKSQLPLSQFHKKKRDCGQFNYHRTITISGSFIILKCCHAQKPFAWKKSLKHKRLSYCPNNRAILIQSDATTNYSKQKHPPIFKQGNKGNKFYPEILDFKRSKNIQKSKQMNAVDLPFFHACTCTKLILY